MSTVKPAKKTKVPPPGRKLSLKEAEERVVKKFGNALEKLAK